MICHEMIRSKSCFILQITRGKTLSYFAFASKADSDNLTDFAKSGSWSMYDQELINNGPKYKYKMPVRLVGALGRLLDPKELTEENRDKLTELISKNVKKIIPIAASLNSPEIVQALFDFGFVNKKMRKQYANCWKTTIYRKADIYLYFDHKINTNGGKQNGLFYRSIYS